MGRRRTSSTASLPRVSVAAAARRFGAAHGAPRAITYLATAKITQQEGRENRLSCFLPPNRQPTTVKERSSTAKSDILLDVGSDLTLLTHLCRIICRRWLYSMPDHTYVRLSTCIEMPDHIYVGYSACIEKPDHSKVR